MSPETSILSPNYHSPQCSDESGQVSMKPSMIVAQIGTKNMKLYLREIPTKQRLIIAGDHTPWPRTEAPTLKDRTYEHGAKVISGKPITLGHGYSTIAWIPEDKGSWALPLRHERITSEDNPY